MATGFIILVLLLWEMTQSERGEQEKTLSCEACGTCSCEDTPKDAFGGRVMRTFQKLAIFHGEGMEEVALAHCARPWSCQEASGHRDLSSLPASG